MVAQPADYIQGLGQPSEPSEPEPEFVSPQQTRPVSSRGVRGPEGRTFEQIQGTPYKSEAERVWYLSQLNPANLGPEAQKFLGQKLGQQAARNQAVDLLKIVAGGGPRNIANTILDQVAPLFPGGETIAKTAANVPAAEELRRTEEAARQFAQAEMESGVDAIDEYQQRFDVARREGIRDVAQGQAEAAFPQAAEGAIPGQRLTPEERAILARLQQIEEPEGIDFLGPLGDPIPYERLGTSYEEVRDALGKVGGLTGRAVETFLPGAGVASLALEELTGAGLSDVGRVAGEVAAPEYNWEATIEFIPGVGFLPDAARGARRGAGTLGRTASALTRGEVTPVPQVLRVAAREGAVVPYAEEGLAATRGALQVADPSGVRILRPGEMPRAGESVLYHGTAGELRAGGLQKGTFLTPSAEDAARYAETTARLSTRPAGPVAKVVNRSRPLFAKGERGALDPSRIFRHGDEVVVDGQARRVVNTTPDGGKVHVDYHLPDGRVRDEWVDAERVRKPGEPGADIVPSNRYVTSKEGGRLAASPENIQQAVQRALTRKTPPAITVTARELQDNPRIVLDQLADALAEAKTRGGKPLFRGVKKGELEDAVAQFGDRVEFYTTRTGKTRARLRVEPNVERVVAEDATLLTPEQAALAKTVDDQVETALRTGVRGEVPSQTFPPAQPRLTGEGFQQPLGAADFVSGARPAPASRTLNQMRLERSLQETSDAARLGASDATVNDMLRAAEENINALPNWGAKQLRLDGPFKVGQGGTAADVLYQAANLPRTLMSSLDFSYPLRQGGVFSVSRFQEWRRAFRAGLESFTDDRAALRAMDQIDGLRATGQIHPELARTRLTREGGRLSQREEGIVSNWVGKVPVLRGNVDASIVFINKLRHDVYLSTVRRWMASGKPPTESELRALAHYINAATGRGNLGSFENAATTLAQAFFSPRLLLARFQGPLNLLNWKNPRVMKEAAKDYASFVAARAALLGLAYGAGSQLGIEVQANPLHTDFGQLKVGNTRIDIWGGYTQLPRLISRLADGEAITTNGIKRNVELGDEILAFLTNKISPQATIAKMAYDEVFGDGAKFFGGKDVDFKSLPGIGEFLYNTMSPLFIQNMVDAITEGNTAGALLSTSTFFGTAARTHPPSLAGRLNEQAKEKFDYANSYDELIPMHQAQLLKDDPEVSDFEKASPFLFAYQSAFRYSQQRMNRDEAFADKALDWLSELPGNEDFDIRDYDRIQDAEAAFVENGMATGASRQQAEKVWTRYRNTVLGIDRVTEEMRKDVVREFPGIIALMRELHNRDEIDYAPGNDWVTLAAKVQEGEED